MGEVKRLERKIRLLKKRIEWMEFDMEYMIFNEDCTGDYITDLVHKTYGHDYTWDYYEAGKYDNVFEDVFSLDLPNDKSEIGVYKVKKRRSNG
jgi:hypothetical protein